MSNRYEIIAPLAQGGQGDILLARRVGPAGFAKLVVLKKPKEALRSPALVAALIEEARLLAQINHSNVCQVHDLEEANGEFFLALEYLEGLTAWDVLVNAEDSRAPIEPGAVCGIVAQACDGLAAIHKLRSGVVHRDISPSNLFVTDSGTIKILDLGIAKSADSEEHTPFGRVKGKLTYLSPEQVQGRPIDGRADLFALGLVLYDLAKGKRPQRDRIGALAAIDVDDVEPALAAVIRRATAAEPDARFASATEMAAALRTAGSVLGAFYERGELADWLARRFVKELAQRKQQLRMEEEHTAAQTSMASRVLTMRSALHDQPAPTVTHAALYTSGTERLPLPEHERLTSSAYFAAEQLTARAPAKPRQRRALVIAASATLCVAAGVAIVIGFSSSPRSAPVAHAEQRPNSEVQTPVEPQAQPQQEPQPQPQPQPQQEPQPQPKPQPQPQPKPRPHEKKVVKHDGMLTVDSNPYAVIQIDGSSIGTTPIYRATIAAGKHKLRAIDPSGREQVQTITVEDGKENRVRIDWNRP